jgi:putative ABC transport system permease protein
VLLCDESGFAKECRLVPAAVYRSHERLGLLFEIFAGLTIGIACLSLFGLTVFTTARRKKEIGVRKVPGASVSGIVLLLSGNFLKSIGVAFL